jgi:hypothetical protein
MKYFVRLQISGTIYISNLVRGEDDGMEQLDVERIAHPLVAKHVNIGT